MIDKFKNFLFGEQSLRQTLAKNSFWFAVSNVGGSLIRLIVVIVAARMLGASNYGLFSYALAVAATFTILSDFGLNYLFSINIARQDENEPGYLSTLAFLRGTLIIVIIAITVVVAPLLTRFQGAKALIPLVAIMIASDDIRGFLIGFVRAENRIDKEAFTTLTVNVLIVILSLIGLHYDPTPYTLMLAYLAASVAGTCLMLFLVRRDIKGIFKPFMVRFAFIKNILAIAVPFGLANTMWILMTSTDALVIGWFRSASELGYYAAAQRPISALSLVPTILAASSLTLIARAAKEGAYERLKILLERLVTFSLAVVFPVAVGGILLAPSIIHFLYGAEYMPAALPFQLLFITLAINYPASVITNLILAFKQQKIFTAAMVAGAVGNFLLDLVLIPPFGIAGSVLATIGALGIINGYIWYSAKKLQPFAVLPFLPRIALATGIMGFITFVLHAASINLFVNIAISAAVYLGILVFTQEPLLKDLRGLFRFQ